ncbi:MAG: hypothetical protein AAF721_37310 [Myxococcota bacterium]
MVGFLSTAAMVAPLFAFAPASVDTCEDCIAEPAPRWDYDGIYMLTGLAPGATVHLTGINPMLRFDTEVGMHWKRGKWAVGFGADAWLLKYYERKKVGGGLHGVVTLTRKPLYVRAGAGSLVGVPGSPNDNDVRPAVGGLLGFGLEGGGSDFAGRFGVDYHASFDKAGRLNNTFLLTLRFKFG